MAARPTILPTSATAPPPAQPISNLKSVISVPLLPGADPLVDRGRAALPQKRRAPTGPAHRAIRSSVAVYDKTGFPLLFNFFYDILQLSSGRDKVCAFIQNGAKFASEALARTDSEFYYICRGTEDSLSDGRKVRGRRARARSAGSTTQ